MIAQEALSGKPSTYDAVIAWLAVRYARLSERILPDTISSPEILPEPRTLSPFLMMNSLLIRVEKYQFYINIRWSIKNLIIR